MIARATAAASAALLCALTSPARADEIDYKKLYARVAPGVVLIYGEAGQTGSVGTGSIIRDDGLVVTNAHVILNHETGKPFEKLFVFLKPDRVTGSNRGNSGGPLLDGNGYMIGINTSIARRSADGLAITGVNFAIKSAVVRSWIAEANQQIAAAPVPPEEHAPPPAAVAKAAPAPPAQEKVPPTSAPAAEPTMEIVPQPGSDSESVQVSAALPAAPPPAKRGFSSSARVGKVLSPLELTRQRAQAAFDELDAESGKHAKR
jgi:hypothetical protein